MKTNGISPEHRPSAATVEAPITVVRAEPDTLVRSAKGYADEARSQRHRTLALYLEARAEEGRKVATLALAITAISQAHQVARHPSPRSARLVKETWKGIRRRLGVAPTQKDPVSAKDIYRMLDELPARLLGLRDRALIALGFAGGFRRSELVSLDCADLTFVSEGLEALVRRSKTDQEGAGLTQIIAYASDPATCPVRACRTGWNSPASAKVGYSGRSTAASSSATNA